jgi:hypothetical protein
MHEDQLLDIEFRKQVIAEIVGSENLTRKDDQRRRYDVYKDRTSKHVMASFKADRLKPETLAQMESRVSNLSICRKIVSKLARTYSGGVIRTSDSDDNTLAVQEMARFLKFNDKMKKADRYRELHRNCIVGFLPEKSGGTPDEPTMRVGMRVFGPWEYDVIEDCFNREIARCVILSDYLNVDNTVHHTTPQAAAYHGSGSITPGPDGVDQVIADSPIDQRMAGRRQTFIWWSDNYHFTTYEDGTYCGAMMEVDENGETSPLNPISMLPFVNNAEEQDGRFWAEGGEDIVDGSILVNKTLTDMFFVAYMQGFGMLVITGRNLKDSYAVGPGQALLFDYDPEKDDPKPEVSFASASPNLEMYMKSIEQYVAMLLTTNNLSVTQVSGNLEPKQFPSGIAQIVEQSEVTNETEDKYSQYADQERQAFRIIQAWQADIQPSADADPAFKVLPTLPPDIGMTLTTRFTPIKPVLTEGERLANIKARKELGISTMAEVIMIDNPDMTEQQAEEKLLKISEESLKRMQMMMPAGGSTFNEDETEEEVEADAE